MLEGQLAEIDLRRSVIENLLSGMPHDPGHCDGSRHRQELEAEMRSLWIARVEIARQLSRASNRREPEPHARRGSWPGRRSLTRV